MATTRLRVDTSIGGIVVYLSDTDVTFAGTNSIIEGGGTTLLFGAINDSQLLQRSGTTIIGVAGASNIIESGASTTLSFGTIAANSVLYRGAATAVAGAPLASQGSALLYTGTAFVDSVRTWGIGSTSTTGLALRNTTPSTAGATVQYSPSIVIGGTAWDTDDLVSRTEDWAIEVATGSGTTTSGAMYLKYAQDGGAWATNATFYSSNTLRVTGAVQAAQGNIFLADENIQIGLGQTQTFGANRDRPGILLHQSALRDAADAIVFATVWDRSAATITNAATVRLHAFAWVTNANVYTELASVRADGSIYGEAFRVSNDLGGIASHVSFTNTVEGAAGAATGDYLVFYNGATKLKLQIFADS